MTVWIEKPKTLKQWNGQMVRFHNVKTIAFQKNSEISMKSFKLEHAACALLAFIKHQWLGTEKTRTLEQWKVFILWKKDAKVLWIGSTVMCTKFGFSG